MEKPNLEKAKEEATTLKFREESKTKSFQNILTSELSGKTQADLSPEQAEAERIYCEKVLRGDLRRKRLNSSI